jgi:phosphate butyryltransferase
MITSLQEVLLEAKRRGPKTLVMPAAHEEAALEACVLAKREKLAESILLGERAKIIEGLKKVGGDPGDFEIIEEPDTDASAARAVALIREGKADVLLKGHMQTAQLLKPVLDPDKGLRTGRLLSDVFMYEDPLASRPRLMFLTDGGVNPLPDIQQKKQIIENAVEVCLAMGIQTPKVACLAAVELPSPKMPATTDAVELKAMNQRGEIQGCVVDGPFAFDNAILAWCAEAKGIKSSVPGNADILLAPSVEVGNILAKSIIYYVKAKMGHIVKGAKAPVVISSRTDEAEAKVACVAMALVCA